MIRVTLFGRFSAGTEKSRVPLRDGSKAQELFAYLLLGGRRAHTREALANVLWSDCPTDTSKAYLRKALWQLRWALVKCDQASEAFLQLDTEWIQVNPESSLWIDVTLFERVYRENCDIEAAMLRPAAVDAMQEAVELYRGGVLPNRYETWCVEEQERYRAMYLNMREKLMDHRIIRGQYESAIEQGKQILRCDGAHERTHQRIMWLHHVQQDRTRALSQYQACTEALSAELGVEPSRQTTQLYRAIRDNAVPMIPPQGSIAPTDQALQSHAISSFRSQIRELSAKFAELQKCAETLLFELETWDADCAARTTLREADASPRIRTLPDTSSQRVRTETPIASIKPVIHSKSA